MGLHGLMQGLPIRRAALQHHFGNVLLVVTVRREVVVEIIAGGEELLIGLQKRKIHELNFKSRQGKINLTMPDFIANIIIFPMMWVLTHGYQSESFNRVSSVLITSE